MLANCVSLRPGKTVVPVRSVLPFHGYKGLAGPKAASQRLCFLPPMLLIEAEALRLWSNAIQAGGPLQLPGYAFT